MKKKVRKKKVVAKAPKSKVVAAVQFTLGDDGMIGVSTTSTDDCPPQTAQAAKIAADLLFRECRKNGSVAIKWGDKVVLAEPAVRGELPLIGKPDPRQPTQGRY